MTLRVATVLSAREWEPTLVSQARETAAVRIVLRAYQPREIEERADEIDVVVAGADPAHDNAVRIILVKILDQFEQGLFSAASMLVPKEHFLTIGHYRIAPHLDGCSLFSAAAAGPQAHGH